MFKKIQILFLYSLLLSINNQVFVIPNNTIFTLVDITDYPLSYATPIILNPAGTLAYVMNQNNNNVVIINTRTTTAIGYISDPDTTLIDPCAMVFSLDGLTGYIVNYGNDDSFYGSVSIIDLNPTSQTYNSVIGLVNDPDTTFIYPTSIIITPDGTRAYVVNNGSDSSNGSISIIDIRTNTVIGIVTDHSDTLKSPFPIAITQDGLTVYVGNDAGGMYSVGSVSIIDTNPTSQTYNTVIGVVRDNSLDPVISFPESFAITPNGLTLYLVNIEGPHTGNVAIIDIDPTSQTYNTITGTVYDEFNLLLYPNWMTLTPDGLTGYVSTYAGPDDDDFGNIVYFDIPTNTVTNVMNDLYDLTSEPVGVFLYSNGSMILIGNIDNNTISVGFTYLEIAPPTNVTGQSIENKFLTQIDFTDVISWSAPSTGSTPVAYKIYSNSNLTKLVAIVPANGPLQFVQNNLQPNQTYNYYITSVDNNNNQSVPAFISIISKIQGK